MKTTNKFLLGLLAVSALTLNSCKKEEAVVTKNDNTKAASFKLVAAKQANSVLSTSNLATRVMAVVKNLNVGFKNLDNDSVPCEVVSIDSISMPHKITLDYGTGCKSVSGRDFGGKVEIEYTTTDLSIVGSSFKATFINYINDSSSINGDLTFTNMGPAPSGDPVGRFVTNLTTNFTAGGLQITGTNTLFFEMGENDPANDYDNTVIWTGSGNGTTNDGTQFTQTITTPLLTYLVDGCRAPVSGQLLVQSPGLTDKDINYGSGNCDNIATVTEGSSTYDITLQ